MMQFRFAKDLLEKTEYNNIDDYETYPFSIFVCDTCDEKICFAYRDLEKHRFSNESNLKGKDKSRMDKLILALIPKYKLKQNKQIWALTKLDRLKVLIQRLYLRLIGIREIFPPIPSTKENIPDSFIDFYCPKCGKPIRIYYFSYFGGRQNEIGFEIKYILN